MGIPFFTTFINNYLFANKDPYKSINLTGENFIIDGYSLFYFIYYMLQNEDKNTTITERITGRKFANDGLSEKFRSLLKEFKDKCKNVYVVFDGAFGLNTHRRPDPKRDSTIQFDNSHSRLSPLLNDQLKHILRELKIEVQVADGEADPLIVQMAKKHNAYIVARDSDYFLYVAPKGYVPLDTLAFSTLDGKYYYMHDVFQNMTPQCVALWGTTITYNFISFNDLQAQFPVTNASDAKQFSCWLNNSKSDSEKHQRLTCLYTMLRYIQQVGYTEAFNKIIILVSKDHIKLFEQLMDNYNDISLPTRKLTLLGNQIHPYLNELYINGNLDSDVINILVRRQLLHLWKGDNLIHLRLLLPMCNILLKWDHSVSNATNQPSTVTFNRQIYNPLELVESEDMPLLAQLADLDESKRKGLVLGCVDFALRPKRPLNWHGIHKDYKLWLSLLKLWWHTKTEHSNSMKMTLVALIISFLKHALLDTYGETKERLPRSEVLPEKPYRQHSHNKLKSYFPRKECYELRQRINKYADIVVSNNEIEQELEECQQFYKELLMINQFFEQPYGIPSPEFCFSRLTYPLAVHLSQSKYFWKDIENFCLGHKFLFEFIKEFYDFFVTNIPPSFE